MIRESNLAKVTEILKQRSSKVQVPEPAHRHSPSSLPSCRIPSLDLTKEQSAHVAQPASPSASPGSALNPAIELLRETEVKSTGIFCSGKLASASLAAAIRTDQTTVIRVKSGVFERTS